LGKLYAESIKLIADGADTDTITLARALDGTLEDQRFIAGIKGVKRPSSIKAYAEIVKTFRCGESFVRLLWNF